LSAKEKFYGGEKNIGKNNNPKISIYVFKSLQAKKMYPFWNNLRLSLQKKVPSLQLFSNSFFIEENVNFENIRIFLRTMNNIRSSLKNCTNLFNTYNKTSNQTQDLQREVQKTPNQKRENTSVCKIMGLERDRSPHRKSRDYLKWRQILLWRKHFSLRTQQKRYPPSQTPT
jgi:hypothetical protein